MIFNASCLPKKASMFVFLVGGGTCGCALAARLSEIADWKILLVEAGGEQPSKVKIPWFHLWLTDSPLDWRYVTEPQNNAMWAFEQQVCRIIMSGRQSRHYPHLEIICIMISHLMTLWRTFYLSKGQKVMKNGVKPKPKPTYNIHINHS